MNASHEMVALRSRAAEVLARATGIPAPEWRLAYTDISEQPDSIAPVCTDEGHEPDDPTVYDCCPEPVIEVGPEVGAYLVALLNADRTAEEKTTATAAAVTPPPTPAVLRAEDADDLTTLAPALDTYFEISDDTIRLDLTATREQWSAWQSRLSVDPARTTYRGSSVTSHATWRGLHVAVRCYLTDSRKDGRS